MSNKNEQIADDFLFGGMTADDQSMSVFDAKETSTDGIYRPLLKDAKDKKVGYKATIRFLPNYLENGKLGPSAIEKHVHYVDFKNDANLRGYYDCRKNHEPSCELCTEYWRLFNSKNQSDVEKAALLNRTTKYYSYVLIIEDEQHPELVGKIMIYPYGYTIKEKIKSEKEGEVTGNRCNVFDLVNGKDFKLIIKDKAGYQNYDASGFQEVSPLKIYSEKDNSFKVIPTEDGLVTNPKVQAKIREFLLGRTVKLDDHVPVEWDQKMITKASQIISVLNGKDFYVAEQKSKGNDVDDNQKINSEATSADDFFDIEEDE